MRIDREGTGELEPVYGFVASTSVQWVAIQKLADGVYFDGYELLRLAHITNVEDENVGGYIERAVAALGRPEIDFYLTENEATSQVLLSAENHSHLIAVHTEIDDPDAMLVGKLACMDDETFVMHLIRPNGEWHDEPMRCSYGDVTRVTFGDRYTVALDRFGEQYEVSQFS